MLGSSALTKFFRSRHDLLDDDNRVHLEAIHRIAVEIEACKIAHDTIFFVLLRPTAGFNDPPTDDFFLRRFGVVVLDQK